MKHIPYLSLTSYPLFMDRIIPGDPKRWPPLLKTRSQNNNNWNVKEAERNPLATVSVERGIIRVVMTVSVQVSFSWGVAGRWAVVSWQRCHCQPVSSRSAERIIHQGLIRGRKTTRCLAEGAACASEYYRSTRTDQVQALWQRVKRMCRVSVLFRSIGASCPLSGAQCDFNVLLSAL